LKRRQERTPYVGSNQTSSMKTISTQVEEAVTPLPSTFTMTIEEERGSPQTSMTRASCQNLDSSLRIIRLYDPTYRK
jgi:hypothetical protein